MQPVRLTADNFTPPSRTPWGGTRIAERYKSACAQAGLRIGESWEVSVEPSFPSVIEGGGRLAEAIAADPRAWLGDDASYQQLSILVKLLDADDDLSVQVHPAMDDPTLADDESGKPESWVILDAVKGAGLYLGFRDGVTEDEVRRCTLGAGRLDELMTFVPVTSGDVFVIDAGTPHAIGAGVTLVEPQLVMPGKRGLTHRFWDWNRRYDTDGNRDPEGALRPLHVERSLAVTRWNAPRGDAFVATCRPTRATIVPGRDRIVDWSHFEVEDWSGDTTLEIDAPQRLSALTCVKGSATIEHDGGEVEIEQGRSVVIPAALGSHRVQMREAQIIVTRPR